MHICKQTLVALKAGMRAGGFLEISFQNAHKTFGAPRAFSLCPKPTVAAQAARAPCGETTLPRPRNPATRTTRVLHNRAASDKKSAMVAK